MLGIHNSSEESETEPLSEEIGNNSDWLDSDLETGAEKHWDADAVIKEEKTWMEIMRGKAKKIALVLGLLSMFGAGKATAEEIQAFVSQDKDSDKIEMIQKSESEIDQAVEAKIQEYLSSLPENVTDRQISVRKDGAGESAISAAPSGENIFVANHHYQIDFMNPQDAGNVMNVERKSGEVSVFGRAENIEADGEIFKMKGHGATEKEALTDALKEAARYMGTSIALDSEKDAKDQSVSLYNQSEHTAAHYVKSYKEIPGETMEEERPDGEKYYTVEIEVQPGKAAAQQQ